jgi:hypothetical protein
MQASEKPAHERSWSATRQSTISPEPGSREIEQAVGGERGKEPDSQNRFDTVRHETR